MNMYTYKGGCHCGNISFDMQLAGSANGYGPRACDCSFCRAHAATYVSDPRGKLHVRVNDAAHLGRYRQGSGIADFLTGASICAGLPTANSALETASPLEQCSKTPNGYGCKFKTADCFLRSPETTAAGCVPGESQSAQRTENK